jgi:peptidoglycan/xylan/chitin deacetylase (PgdA/CDA1 family)
MLQAIKRSVFRLANNSGLNSAVLNSAWRERRLLILCYHGISHYDEHEWDPSLYLAAPAFRAGFELLRQMKCNVLPLDEAVAGLKAGTLPPRSVAITFDDGFYDFYLHALPVIQEYLFPVTLYLTTYYCEKNLPVFDPMLSYLVWKGKANPAEVRDLKLQAHKFDRTQKDALLRDLAHRLQLDYEGMCSRRILHLMRPDEVRHVAEAGIDIQLHTHRHRVSNHQSLFDREITDNRDRIKAFTGQNGQRHFCYPGGFYLQEFGDWLRQLGVVSATTCQPGLAAPDTDPLFLPRLVLTGGISRDDLRAWVSGFADLVPHRRTTPAAGQLLEGPPV